jgi:hypothetical protein
MLKYSSMHTYLHKYTLTTTNKYTTISKMMRAFVRLCHGVQVVMHLNTTVLKYLLYVYYVFSCVLFIT